MRNSVFGRFKVWDRSEDAFNGEDLVANFDEIDRIIGNDAEAFGRSGPSSSYSTTNPSGGKYAGTPSKWLGSGDTYSSPVKKYPGTTNGGKENISSKRDLYSVVSGLNFNDVPLGTVIAWWRPNKGTPIPNGWVVCNGQTVPATEHSFVGVSDSIVVPDLRNKFVLGAEVKPENQIDAVGTTYKLNNAPAAQNKNNLWNGTTPYGDSGAPAIGYDSGLEPTSALTGNNDLREGKHSHASYSTDASGVSVGLRMQDHRHDVRHYHKVNSHFHVIEGHSHDFSHVHLSPNHVHALANEWTGDPKAYNNHDAEGTVTFHVGSSSNGTITAAGANHVHRVVLPDTGTRKPIDDGPHYGLNGGPLATGTDGRFIWIYKYVNPAYMGGKPSLSFGFPFGTSYANMSTLPLGIAAPDQRNMSAYVRTETSAVRLTTNAPAADVYTGITPSRGWSLMDPDWVRIPGSSTSIRPADDLSGGIVVSSSDPVDTGVTTTDRRMIIGNTASSIVNINVRPQYVGLLYLIKVKVSTNLI